MVVRGGKHAPAEGSDALKILVVDDEAPARRRLIRLLEALEEEIEITGEARDGVETLAAVNRRRPDLILLDIQMPALDGLAVASQYADLPPVIFVTAYHEHAIRAFELNAIDYLLKPVRRERLADALRRARSRAKVEFRAFEKLSGLAEASGGFVHPSGMVPQVVTHDRGVIRLFDARTVTRFWAFQKYTLFLADHQEQWTEEPLSALELRLAPFGFLRVHRSELIHPSAVRALQSDEGRHRVTLSDGQVISISRRLLATLKLAIKP